MTFTMPLMIPAVGRSTAHNCGCEARCESSPPRPYAGVVAATAARGDAGQAGASGSRGIGGDRQLARIHHHHYPAGVAAKLSVYESIEAFYNRTRVHSSLGCVSPEQYEKSLK